MDYKIAIPSYKRHQTLKNKTLKILEEHKIDPEKVYIFLANEEEYAAYSNFYYGTPWQQRLAIGKPGLKNVRNFYTKYFEEGDKVVNLDDDISQVLYRVDDKKLAPVVNLEKDVFQRGFDYLKEYDAYIWGIYAASNPFFMKKEVSVGFYFVVGPLWGNIIRHDKDLELTLEEKEDYERTILYYLKDGKVVRMDNITAKTMYYTEPGGMQLDRTPERVTSSAENLVARYPELCSMYFRKTTGRAEIRLRDTRETAATATLESFFGD